MGCDHLFKRRRKQHAHRPGHPPTVPSPARRSRKSRASRRCRLAAFLTSPAGDCDHGDAKAERPGEPIAGMARLLHDPVELAAALGAQQRRAQENEEPSARYRACGARDGPAARATGATLSPPVPRGAAPWAGTHRAQPRPATAAPPVPIRAFRSAFARAALHHPGARPVQQKGRHGLSVPAGARSPPGPAGC